MLKTVLAAAFAVALIAAPMAPALAQAKTEKSEKKAEKKLTPQQQKMKDCGAKWQAHKKEHNVKGQAEYRKFQSTCLKS
jgi:Ni/Co efflux regulator RcnB